MNVVSSKASKKNREWLFPCNPYLFEMEQAYECLITREKMYQEDRCNEVECPEKNCGAICPKQTCNGLACDSLPCKGMACRKRIDWKQNVNQIKKDDIVYLYISRTDKSIQYKCKVVEIGIDANLCLSDKIFDKGLPPAYTFVRLEFLGKYPKDLFTLSVLREHGQKSVQRQQEIKTDDLLNLLARSEKKLERC